ncbi:MAG: hypothetical protein V3V32_05995 [Dehalococcoidia bacterium]
MEKKDGKVKEVWGRQFRIVKNGLDEGEVFSLVGNLIEQNSEYAAKLEGLESLTRLAESTVIEANKQAQQTMIEIDQQANETATAIISEAEDKAKTEADFIITEAQQKATLEGETILAKAEKAAKGMQEKAETALAKAKQTSGDKVSAAEQLAQDILEGARAEAEQRKAVAEDEAAKIISDVRQEAEESARVTVDAAEEQRQNVLRIAKEEAEKEVLAAKQEAMRLLVKSKQIAESEIRETFGRIYQEMLSTLELGDGAQTTAESIEESTDPEPSQAEAVANLGVDWTAEDLQQETPGEQEEPNAESELETRACAEEEATSEEPQGTQSPTEVPGEGSEEGSQALYEGTVELQVPAPVVFDRMMQLHKNLRQIPEVEEVNLRQPTDKGLMIELRLSSPIPLLRILGDLPGVDEVSDGLRETEDASLLRRLRGKPHCTKIVVTTTRD